MSFTKSDVARRLGVSINTVSRYIAAGLLTATKAPGRAGAVTIEPAELRAFRTRQRELAQTTFDTATVGRMLGVDRRTVQRLVRLGELRAAPDGIGRALRISRGSVVAYRARLRGMAGSPTGDLYRVAS